MARKRKHRMPGGFVSRKQWKWAFANRKSFAHKEAHKVIARRGKVTGYRSLPVRTGRKRTTRRRG